jgi:signal transduction histidine kinase
LVVFTLGLIFFFLVARAAQRIGADAAIRRLRKWTRLPNSVLSLVSAPNYRTALQSVAITLAEALNARGVLVVLSENNGECNGAAHQLLLTNGTLQGSSDVNMLTAVKSADVFSDKLGGNPFTSSLIDINTKEMPAQFRQVFSHLSDKGQLVGFGLRLHGRHRSESSTQSLMLFDLGHQKSLDRFEVEAIQATVEQFPRVAESLTGRFAQAELSEKLLEESRRRDEILQQMLNGFQHDVANALRNIELSVEVANTTMLNDDATPSIGSLESAFAGVKDAVTLAGQVAYSASMLPEIARGDTPIVEPRAFDPALLFSRLLQPLISVKANARKELVVNYEVAPGLPQIMIDEVPFFRAMSNVIGNAFKFTERGGINILVHRDMDQVAFAVSDTGLGIPADELDRVGNLRFRTSNAADISGSGIGLWTTKRLVEAMGGAIGIESKMGRGSTVILRFQIASNGDGYP